MPAAIRRAGKRGLEYIPLWKHMKKKVPKLKTDRQAEEFLARDLSKLDFSRFKIVRFEFEKKDNQINMRVPKQLLEEVKARAKARGIPYTRFIRETLEQAMATRK